MTRDKKRKDRKSGDITPQKTGLKQQKLSSFVTQSKSKVNEEIGSQAEGIMDVSGQHSWDSGEESTGEDIVNQTNNERHSTVLRDIMSNIDRKLSTLKPMQDDITEMKQAFKDVTEALEFSEARLKEAYAAIMKAQKENIALKSEVETLNYQSQILLKKINDLEDYSRRENIIISGVRESRGENCFHIVKDILSNIEMENVVLQRCHRLGRPTRERTRDIIIRLLNYQDVIVILQRRKHLPNGIYANEDFSPQTRRRINTLRPVFKEARKIDKNSKIIGDRMFYKNKEFTTRNISSIDINTSKIAEKTDGPTLAFASRFSGFSNLFPNPVEIEGKVYPSTEHYYQYQKCLAAGDHETASEVLLSPEPEDAMAIGQRVRRTNKWYQNEGKELMKKALRAKFREGKMKQKFIATGRVVIVEATRNQTWGTGVPFTSNDVLNPRSFSGQNLMGVSLMEVRSELVASVDSNLDLSKEPLAANNLNTIFMKTQQTPLSVTKQTPLSV